jgi:hypothetical protein
VKSTRGRCSKARKWIPIRACRRSRADALRIKQFENPVQIEIVFEYRERKRIRSNDGAGCGRNCSALGSWSLDVPKIATFGRPGLRVSALSRSAIVGPSQSTERWGWRRWAAYSSGSGYHSENPSPAPARLRCVLGLSDSGDARSRRASPGQRAPRFKSTVWQIAGRAVTRSDTADRDGLSRVVAEGRIIRRATIYSGFTQY